MRLYSGLSVLPGNPAVWAIAVLFLFHYFKHSETFQAQNELQGRLLKAEGETHSWAACGLVTLQPETPALTKAPSWHLLRRKEEQKGEMAKGSVQGESVLSLFLSETNKKRLEKWDIFSLLKTSILFLFLTFQGSEGSRFIKIAFPCGYLCFCLYREDWDESSINWYFFPPAAYSSVALNMYEQMPES